MSKVIRPLVIRPLFTSVIPEIIEIIILYGIVAYIIIDEDINIKQTVSDLMTLNNLDECLFLIFILFLCCVPIYFILKIINQLRTSIFITHNSFVIQQIFKTTEIPFKDINEVRVLENPETYGDPVIGLFKFFGQRHLALSLGFGCLVFFTKNDEKWFNGFTPDIAKQFKKYLPETRQ